MSKKREVENVRKLQEIKAAAGSELLKLKWQYILMEHKELVPADKQHSM